MPKEATIDLLPKQTEAWEAWEDPEILELGYGGAAGGGKTRLGWYLGITISEQFPGARGVVGRKELKTLRMTTLAELWIIFAELGYKRDLDYSFDAKDNIVKFPNGSQILLLDTAYSPEDAEYTRFGSLPVTWGWIDESNETPEKAKSILKTRVGRANIFNIKGKKVEVKGFWLETFNPNKGHVYRDYYKPWKENTMPKHRKFIRALPGDNFHLPASYIANLERADRTTRERLLKGNFDFDSNPLKIFDYPSITDLPFNTLLPTKTSKIKFLINDIARMGGDKIVIAAWKGLEWYGLSVYTYQGTDETVKRIREDAIEEEVAFVNVLSDEDGVGGGVVDNMKGTKGFMGNSKPLMEWNDIAQKLTPANYSNFRSQCYFKAAELVNNRLIKINITKFKTNIEGYTKEQALSDLFEELDAIKKTDNSEDGKQAIIPKSEIKKEIARSPDFADILEMRMMFELQDIAEDPSEYKPQKAKGQIRVNKAR